jgi:mRNA interferase MazF
VSVGDLHWVDLPAVNGREQGGRRPAVVLQDDDYGGNLPVVLVVPLTTARAAMRFAGTTLIRPTAENGLRQASGPTEMKFLRITRGGMSPCPHGGRRAAPSTGRPCARGSRHEPAGA